MFLNGRTCRLFQRDPLVTSAGILVAALVWVTGVGVEVRKAAKLSEMRGQLCSKESPFPKSHLPTWYPVDVDYCHLGKFYTPVLSHGQYLELGPWGRISCGFHVPFQTWSGEKGAWGNKALGSGSGLGSEKASKLHIKDTTFYLIPFITFNEPNPWWDAKVLWGMAAGCVPPVPAPYG